MYHLQFNLLESLMLHKLLHQDLMKLVQVVSQGDLKESCIHQKDLFLVLVTDSGEPSCYKEAMLAGDHAKWELAMKSKLASFENNGTWNLVPLPQDKKALPCKWVYKRKFASGVGTYKA